MKQHSHKPEMGNFVRFDRGSDGRSVYIIDSHGGRHLAPALWLREHSPKSMSSSNRQRLVDPWTLPTDLTLTGVEYSNDGGIDLTFSDGHCCTLKPDDLRDEFDPHHGCPPLEPWTSKLTTLPRTRWAAIADGDIAATRAALHAFLRFGFLLITDVPCQDQAVVEVASRFGQVRETNFGRYFNVRKMDSPNDQAYTAVALGPHTDCNYRDQVPGIQLLHCLVNQTNGGESTLVDGLAVTQALKAEDPAAYNHLSTIPVRFCFVDTDTSYVSWHPLIEHDATGAFAGVHFSPRTDFVPLLDAATLEAFYAARRRLAQMLENPAFELRFRLGEGELIMFDNHRVLHGRTAFNPGTRGGERHLQGCYIDRDEPASLFRVL